MICILGFGLSSYYLYLYLRKTTKDVLITIITKSNQLICNKPTISTFFRNNYKTQQNCSINILQNKTFIEDKNLKIILNSYVIKVENNIVIYKNTINNTIETLIFDKLILATGTNVKNFQNIKNIINNINSNLKIIHLNDLEYFKDYIESNNENFFIIGSGLTACEVVEDILNKNNSKVYLIHGKYQLLSNFAPKECSEMWKKKLKNKFKNRISFILENYLTFLKDKKGIVIVSTGLQSNYIPVSLKNSKILTNNDNFFVVNKSYKTSLKNVWAIGDCCIVKNRKFHSISYIIQSAKIIVKNILKTKNCIKFKHNTLVFKSTLNPIISFNYIKSIKKFIVKKILNYIVFFNKQKKSIIVIGNPTKEHFEKIKTKINI